MKYKSNIQKFQKGRIIRTVEPLIKQAETIVKPAPTKGYFDAVMSKAKDLSADIPSLSNDELVARYMFPFQHSGRYGTRTYMARSVVAPDGTKGFSINPWYRFNHTPENFGSLGQELGAEINKRGLFPGIDFADVSSVDKISAISEKLKQYPFVKDYRAGLRMPLDIRHMFWARRPMISRVPEDSEYIGDGKFLFDIPEWERPQDYIKGLPIARTKDFRSYSPKNTFKDLATDMLGLPTGTSITELDRSADSEGFVTLLTGRNYGTGRGQVTATRVRPELVTDDPDKLVKGYWGNLMHLTSASYNPDAKEIVVNDEKPRVFEGINLSKIISGTASDAEKAQLQRAFDWYNRRTIGHIGTGVDLLNRADPTLKLEAPYLGRPDYSIGSYTRLTMDDFIDAINKAPYIKSAVHRDPIYSDLHKQGGKINRFKSKLCK